MSDLSTLLLAFGISLAIFLLWHVVREIRSRLRWNRMWKDLVDIDDIDEGRERWHRFLREDGNEHKIPLPKIEEIFQGMWRDSRLERADCREHRVSGRGGYGK